MSTQPDSLKQSLLSTQQPNPHIQHSTSQQIDSSHDSNPSGKTTLSVAIFAMMVSALGTGVFNLPLRVSQVGVCLFIVYVVAGGFISYMGCYFLQRLILQKGFNTYSQICSSASGRVLKLLIQFCILIFPWGITICFQVIIPRFLLQILSDTFQLHNLYKNRQKQIYSTTGEWIRILINIIVMCTQFYFVCLRDIKTIQKLSIIGVFSAVYNVFVIFCVFFIGFDYSYEGVCVHYQGVFGLDWGLVKWVAGDGNWFSTQTQALASVIFCYINHQLVFTTCKNLQNPTKQRLTACFFRSNLYQLIIYVVVGLSGYLLLVQHLNILPINAIVLASIDIWPVTIGKFLTIFTLYIAIPLNLFPARAVLHEVFNLQKSTKNRYLTSLGLSLSSCFVAITFRNVNSYFGLLGGSCGVLMAGIIPAFCFWKLIISTNQNQGKFSNYIMLFFVIFISILAFIGALLSVFDPV